MNSFEFLDMESWKRKNHFLFFQGFQDPHVNVTAPFDITNIYNYRRNLIKDGKKAPNLMDILYYMAMRSVNSIPEFKFRLVDRKPVEFKRIDCFFTHIPQKSNLHVNCSIEYNEDFKVFEENMNKAKEMADRGEIDLSINREHPQAFIYFTVTPGLSFTSFKSPWGDPWVDSIPRIAFGKIERVMELKSNKDKPEKRYKVSVGIEALHSFIDGIHGQQFAKEMMRLNANPAKFLK